MSSEQDIARPVVEWLREFHWDVHQEVESGPGGRRADIVAVQGPLLWVVEVKASFTLALLDQAIQWRDRADYVSIAVPVSNQTRSPFALAFLREQGIGVIRVDRYGTIRQDQRPALGRRRVLPALRERLVARLCEETRTYAEAGNAQSRYWSPFKQTCEEVRRVLADGPLTVRELVDRIDKHHYANDASARSTLPRWIQAGKVPGVEIVPDSRPLQCRLSAQADAA